MTKVLIQWALSYLRNWVYLICPVMSQSGAKIGSGHIEKSLKQILLVHRMVVNVFAEMVGQVNQLSSKKSHTDGRLRQMPMIIMEDLDWSSLNNDFCLSSPPAIKSIGISWQSRIIIVTSPKNRKFSKGIGYGTKRRY